MIDRHPCWPCWDTCLFWKLGDVLLACTCWWTECWWFLPAIVLLRMTNNKKFWPSPILSLSKWMQVNIISKKHTSQKILCRDQQHRLLLNSAPCSEGISRLAGVVSWFADAKCKPSKKSQEHWTTASQKFEVAWNLVTFPSSSLYLEYVVCTTTNVYTA